VLIKVLPHSGSVQSVIWSQDGKRILTDSYDGTVRTWDTEKEVELFLFKRRVFVGPGSPFSALSPDGKRVIIEDGDNTFYSPREMRVLDAETGQELSVLKRHEDCLGCFVFSNNGKYIASGSYDRTAKIWDSFSGELLMDLVGHTNRVRWVSWHPSDDIVATASDDKTVRLWDVCQHPQALAFKQAIADGDELARLAYRDWREENGKTTWLVRCD
jgi:WD40 repeat protein